MLRGRGVNVVVISNMYSIWRFAKSFKHVKVKFGQEAWDKIVQGIDEVAKSTVKTYGPGGWNVALEYEAGDPKIQKDGVTVAKSIFFSDREKEIGAKLIKRVANNTNNFAGDGTTLSTLFANSII